MFTDKDVLHFVFVWKSDYWLNRTKLLVWGQNQNLNDFKLTIILEQLQKMSWTVPKSANLIGEKMYDDESWRRNKKLTFSPEMMNFRKIPFIIRKWKSKIQRHVCCLDQWDWQEFWMRTKRQRNPGFTWPWRWEDVYRSNLSGKIFYDKWKSDLPQCGNFRIFPTQILREIAFGHFEGPKTVILTFLAT